jgi:cell division protein FtsI (penicillin-binding protein 3)/stage V sporulation protein D (sporulation-specific penicillin-binding protein)
MKTSARSRALFTCFGLAGIFTLFSFRLIQVQVARADEFTAEATAKHATKQVIYARRGLIEDIHGEPLAQNEPVKTVVADASLIKDREAFAALIAAPLEVPEAVIGGKLARMVRSKVTGKLDPCRYIVLKKDVPETTAARLAQLVAEAKAKGVVSNLEAIRFEQDFIRSYPNGSLLCHVLGFTNGENIGMDGVERTMEQYLHGDDGFRNTERDRVGREIVAYRGEEHAARDGRNVKITIDMGLQNIVEQELAIAVRQYRPKSATVILMKPQTGEILAMATRPNFDLNKQSGVPEDFRRNRAITDILEPGSTFKIVTTAAALTERLVRPDTMIFCENGYWEWCKLHDHHPYSDLSVEDILVHSSNIGVGKLAAQLGDQRFYGYARKFGFGERTGVALPGEVGGILHPPHLWSKISLTRLPMGQEVAATPLQIVTATSAIANGGTLMMPQIVSEIVDNDGQTIVKFQPQEVRRVASQKACEAVRDALMRVVSKKGTAALAEVPGFDVAGKTGTAQKADENGKVTHEKYVVSFVGYMPAKDPAFVGLVLLDEAQTKHGENYGGLVAAPVFARIGERGARYLGLKPTKIEEPDGTSVAIDSSKLRDQ